MMNFLKKQRRQDETQRLIRAEMAFLLERDERWFEKQLQARLLDEGCNFPMVLAKPHFYEYMLSELHSIVPAECRPTFQTIIAGNSEQVVTLPHPIFHNAIRFCASKCHDSVRLMALGVTKAIQGIQEEWQLPLEMFQEDSHQFTERVCTTAARFRPQTSSTDTLPIPMEKIRQRLYLALTTALLSKLPVRQEFERDFDSIPALLQAMQADHREFCRFMSFCRERSPYFQSLVSRTYWRTLETVYLEQRQEPV